MSQYIVIEDKRYLWADVKALRRAQMQARPEQPMLFELMEDNRPRAERDAASRYREPSLFIGLE